VKSIDPSLTGSASAPTSTGRGSLDPARSDMKPEPNRPGQTAPVPSMEPVGTTEPPAGSTVIAKAVGLVDPADVNVALMR